MRNWQLTQRLQKGKLVCRSCPCDLFIEGNNTRHLHHHIEWYINWSTEKQNIKMDIRSYFRSASKSSVVSSSSDSEDGNESEIDVQPNPPKKHCSSSTSKPPSKSGSGIRRINKKWQETFPWLEFDENLQGAFCKYAKRLEDLFRGLVGLGLPNHSLPGRRRLSKWNHIQKVKCTFYPVNWMWKLIELEKKDPLSASFKMLESSKDYKIGRRLKL